MCEPEDDIEVDETDVGVEPTTLEEEVQGSAGSPSSPASPSQEPGSPPGITFLNEAQFNPEVFIRPRLNGGFVPPPFLLDRELLAKTRPPAVVKTLEARLAELNDEQMQALVQIRQIRDQKGYDPKEADDWFLLRYLVARDWKVLKAADMIDKTMAWRKARNAMNMVCSRCVVNPNAHCSMFVGWDLQHRPVLYMSHRWALERQNMEENVEHMLESYNHIVKLMPEGVTKWVACVDFVTYSHWRDGSPKSGKEVINMLQDHFPERLAMQVLVDPPTTFWLLWKVLSVFIDPKTKEKAAFWYTDQEPRIQNEFPKIFPEHLSNYLVETYIANKTLPKKK